MSEELNKGDAAFNALAELDQEIQNLGTKPHLKDVQDLVEAKKLEVVHILINVIHSF